MHERKAALVTGSTPPVSLAPFRLGRFAGDSAAGTFVSSYLGAAPPSPSPEASR